MIWTENGVEHLGFHGLLYTYNEKHGAYFTISKLFINPLTMNYNVTGFIHDYSHIVGCPADTTDDMFAFDMHGDCDGTTATLTPRTPGGFSIKATGDQIHAFCLL